MRAKQLKGWLATEKRKERKEAAAERDHLAEKRKTEGPDGMGGK